MNRREIMSLMDQYNDIKQQLYDYQIGPQTETTKKRQERIAKVNDLKKQKQQIELVLRGCFISGRMS
jgi:hypothetical protein